MGRLVKVTSVLVVLALLAAAAVLGLNSARSLDAPLHLSAPLRFKVPAGASFGHVAAELGAQGVVAQPKIWVLYARWKGLAPAVKAGEYEIQPGSTPRELLRKMVNGQVLLHSFTIVDGWRVQDMLEALRRNPEVVATLTQSVAGGAGPRAHGETGQCRASMRKDNFCPRPTASSAARPMSSCCARRMRRCSRKFEGAWAARDPDLPLRSSRDLLIMASIVEKESGLPQELPKIAGLYLHRFAIGMRLQADPTVIYGLGENYDGDIHSVDLRTDGPYNTYTRSGLPPTPIALAGAAALHATARPEKTDALYFVASVKGDGSHVFSATLEQHNAAVAAYVAHQRKAAQESSR